MFNTTYVNSSPRVIEQTTNIKEFRAPTDESVRLLREMENTAYENIIEAFHIKNNTFEAKAFVIPTVDFFEKKLIVRFKLNGEECLFEKKVPSSVSFASNLDDFYYQLYEWLSNMLAAKIAKLLSQENFNTTIFKKEDSNAKIK